MHKIQGDDESLLGEMRADLVEDADGAALDLHPGRASGIPVTLRPRSPVTVGLKLTMSKDAEPGATGDVHLVQRDRAGNIVGGVTVQVRVVRR